MYMNLKAGKDLICEVSVYSIKSEETAFKPWSYSISSYINIENYSKVLLKIPEAFGIAQQEFISNFKRIQNFKQDYFEQITKSFPEPKCYELDDTVFREDKYKIIDVIRAEMKEIANKWGFTYNED